MYKILIAIDSFKGSISSLEAANAIEAGINMTGDNYLIEKIPIADGGEGTVESLVNYKNGELVAKIVNDPLFRKVKAKYGLLDEGKTAVIEMAAASGIMLLNSGELNPLITTTYGTGELIFDALERKVEKIIIGIGGSATNDAGIGMASALGFKFIDADGNLIQPVGGQLDRIINIDDSKIDSRIASTQITVMCDVTNPLLGKNGASFVYGPQKGASVEMAAKLDKNLKYLADIVKKKYNYDHSQLPGSGAAGGLGFGLLTFLNSELKNGIDLLIDILGMEEKIKSSDIVITGEGKMDYQTSNNKAPWGIMKLARKHNKPVFAFTGIVDLQSKQKLLDYFTNIIPIVDNSISVHDSMTNTYDYLTQKAKNLMKKLNHI